MPFKQSQIANSNSKKLVLFLFDTRNSLTKLLDSNVTSINRMKILFRDIQVQVRHDFVISWFWIKSRIFFNLFDPFRNHLIVVPLILWPCLCTKKNFQWSCHEFGTQTSPFESFWKYFVSIPEKCRSFVLKKRIFNLMWHVCFFN